MNLSFLYVLLLAAACFPSSLTFLDSMKSWFYGSESGDEKFDTQSNGFKFEILSADDKFLQLKDAFGDLSPLDSCYHIVVYHLKKRCGELSEEELGKLSVQLLNCQSAAEERPIFACTQSMSLAECTRDMDSTTWNSYHIVSNRARSLCYATQQQQFRRLTEITVSKLVATAHGQLESMQQLQNGQDQLHAITTETVRKLYESQSDLIGNQQELKLAQDDILGHIHTNMKELVREKALITTGNKELADMTENIREKLDTTSKQLLEQETVQIQSHEKILEDLTSIHQKAQDALKKLDNSSKYLIKNHKEMMGHYKSMYDNMMRINTTVTHLLSLVNNMQTNLDDRITWFTHMLGLADDKLSLLTCGALHTGYFMLAAVAASFLQTPAFSRIVMLLMVVLNAIMEVRYGQALDFASITMFITLTCLVNWVILWWCSRRKEKSPMAPPAALAPSLNTTAGEEDPVNMAAADTTTSENAEPLSPVEVRQLAATLQRMYNTCTKHQWYQTASGTKSPGSKRPKFWEQEAQRWVRNEFGTKRPNHGAVISVNDSIWLRGTPQPEDPRPSTSGTYNRHRHRTEQVRPDSSTMDDVSHVRRFLQRLDEASSEESFSPPESRSSTPRRASSRGSVSTLSSRCQGTTRAGTPCRLSSAQGSEYCHKHQHNS